MPKQSTNSSWSETRTSATVRRTIQIGTGQTVPHLLPAILELDAESVPFSFATASSQASVSPDESDDSDASDDQPRRIGPHLPTFFGGYRGSIRLAFLSHAFFLTAALLYVALSFADLSWIRFARSRGIPGEVTGADDDEAWYDWTSARADGSAMDDAADDYDVRSKRLYVSAAACFAVVGVLDWMRYCDVLNVVMILAGVSGVISGLSDTSSKESAWNAISVHLYLAEACNLLRREHDDEGNSCFRLGDVCFLLGSILDVSSSRVGFLIRIFILWVLPINIVGSVSCRTSTWPGSMVFFGSSTPI